MRVAVMQPYLYPYLHYFRLIDRVDLFLIFDCVQFARRGRVHRAPLAGGGWLTLPLARQPQQVKIADLRLSERRDADWQARLTKVSALRQAPDLLAELSAPLPERVLDFVEARLRATCAALGITTPMQRSSEFGLGPEFTGQARVIELARRAGATEYLNLPGGVALYDPADFDKAGIKLTILPDYEGPWVHLLEALASTPLAEIRAGLG